MTTLEEKKQQLSLLRKYHEVAWATVSDISDKIAKLKKEVLLEERASLFDGEVTIEKVMAQRFDEVDHYPKDFHRRVDSFVNRRGMHSMSWNSETGQAYLSTAFDLSKPLEDQLWIVDWIPHILPNKNGVKIVGVFEHTCSEFTSYHIEIRGKNATLIAGHSIEMEGTIREVLAYVHKNHWYEGGKSDEDDNW